MNHAQLKQQAIAAIDSLRAEFIQVSTTLHGNPELAFKEFKSAALLCDTMEKHGLKIQRGIAELETAFRGETRGAHSSPTIAILAEYDALPDIGHACGHNLIGTAAIAAGIALQRVVKDLPGRVIVMGTPAEEGGGGKLILLERGAFKDVDAAMMFHPASRTMTTRGSLASTRLKIEFIGKASHAAAAPEDGINALEAVILTFNNVNALRLHLKSDARVHGIITNGGSAANIIPEYAAATFSVRAASQKYARQVLDRVVACAQAAATATGAELKFSTKPGYSEIIPNPTMARVFAENLRALGIEVNEPRANERMGSTDMGNVSQTIPAIHPYLAITPNGIAGHTVAFRDAAISPAGMQGMLDAAKAMAMTAIDLLREPALLQNAKAELKKTRNEN